jgi:hypothetical protein
MIVVMVHQLAASISPRFLAVTLFVAVAAPAIKARDTTADAKYPRFAQPNTSFEVK